MCSFTHRCLWRLRLFMGILAVSLGGYAQNITITVNASARTLTLSGQLEAGASHNLTISGTTFAADHAYRLTVKPDSGWSPSSFTVTLTDLTLSDDDLTGTLNLNQARLIAWLRNTARKTCAVELWDDTSNWPLGRTTSYYIYAPVQRSGDVPDQSQPIRTYTNDQIDSLCQVAAGDHTHTGTYAVVETVRSEFFPAGALISATTNGAAFDTTEYGTNDVDLDGAAYDSATAEYTEITCSLSKWTGGDFKVKVAWTSDGGSGDVTFSIAARSYGDNEAIDQAWGTAQTVTDTLQTVDYIHITSATPAITPAGTPAAGEVLQLRISRTAAGLANDVVVLGGWIQWPISSTAEASW